MNRGKLFKSKEQRQKENEEKIKRIKKRKKLNYLAITEKTKK